MLPGTACTWQLNFRNAVDDLAEKCQVIAANCDGFEGDPDIHALDTVPRLKSLI